MKSKLIVGILTLFILGGCAVSKGTINSFVEPTYQTGAIKSVAVFSIRNARFAPSEARTVNRKIIQALSKKNPGIKIVSPSEALRKINESDLAENWADFVEDYYTSGIANQNILQKVSTVLGVDAVMQGQMLTVNQRDSAAGYLKAQSRVTMSFSIIETKTAKPIWEASADGIKGSATTMSEAPPLIEAINLAVNKVVENVPKL